MANLKAYVENGGRLIMSFFSGIVDENEHIRLGGYPAPFRDLLGLWVEEFVPYAEAQTNTLQTSDGQHFACSQWADVIHLEGAEPLAHFEQDYYGGGAAVTRHAYGRGVSYYVGTEPASAGLAWLFDRVCAEAGVEPVVVKAPPEVELLHRANGAATWLVALNHSAQQAEVAIDGAGHDLLTGAAVRGVVALEPHGVAIVELAKT